MEISTEFYAPVAVIYTAWTGGCLGVYQTVLCLAAAANRKKIFRFYSSWPIDYKDGKIALIELI